MVPKKKINTACGYSITHAASEVTSVGDRWDDILYQLQVQEPVYSTFGFKVCFLSSDHKRTESVKRTEGETLLFLLVCKNAFPDVISWQFLFTYQCCLHHCRTRVKGSCKWLVPRHLNAISAILLSCVTSIVLFTCTLLFFTFLNCILHR